VFLAIPVQSFQEDIFQPINLDRIVSVHKHFHFVVKPQTDVAINDDDALMVLLAIIGATAGAPNPVFSGVILLVLMGVILPIGLLPKVGKLFYDFAGAFFPLRC
jgi:hypothetical protein